MSRSRPMRAGPEPCPCGHAEYAACCGRFHRGEALPPNAEALMRSRYSAYVKGLVDWLRQTWHATTCPDDLAPERETRWLGLTVKAHAQQDDTHAIVEFVARYKVGGRAWRLHERSRFVFEPRAAGETPRWLYVDGEMLGQDQG
ncbi:YchJ family metal-binding protein [Cupriavidus sp. 2KB_3]|uniref:YchJ family metal-binding protein n=1 Tax=Cupriavidus TaxID=106589 RepID=UPI0011EC78D8|nr:YchJ family metal-binding protein [Cupriavidus campinensis]